MAFLGTAKLRNIAINWIKGITLPIEVNMLPLDFSTFAVWRVNL